MLAVTFIKVNHVPFRSRFIVRSWSSVFRAAGNRIAHPVDAGRWFVRRDAAQTAAHFGRFIGAGVGPRLSALTSHSIERRASACRPFLHAITKKNPMNCIVSFFFTKEFGYEWSISYYKRRFIYRRESWESYWVFRSRNRGDLFDLLWSLHYF